MEGFVYRYTKDKSNYEYLADKAKQKVLLGRFLLKHYEGDGYLEVRQNFSQNFVMLDIDLDFDLRTVDLLLKFLRENFGIRAFASSSFSGRIHIYVPFSFPAKQKFAQSFARKLGKVVRRLVGVCESFPNGRKSFLALPYKKIYSISEGLYEFGPIAEQNMRYVSAALTKHANSYRIVSEFLKKPLVVSSFLDEIFEFAASKGLSLLGDASSLDEFGNLDALEAWKQVAKLCLPHYTPGNRQNIIFALTGLAADLGIPRREVLRFLEDEFFVRDEEKRKRLYLLFRAYRRRENGQRLSYRGILAQYVPYKTLETLLALKSLPFPNETNNVLDALEILKARYDKKFGFLFDEIRDKYRSYGALVVLGYNALSSRYRISKTKVSKALEFFIRRRMITRVRKGFFSVQNDRKLGVGSFYRVNAAMILRLARIILPEEKKAALRVFRYRISPSIREFFLSVDYWLSVASDYFKEVVLSAKKKVPLETKSNSHSANAFNGNMIDVKEVRRLLFGTKSSLKSSLKDSPEREIHSLSDIADFLDQLLI